MADRKKRPARGAGSEAAEEAADIALKGHLAKPKPRRRTIPKDITRRSPNKFEREMKKLEEARKRLQRGPVRPPKKKSPRPPRKKGDWSPSPPSRRRRTLTA